MGALSQQYYSLTTGFNMSDNGIYLFLFHSIKPIILFLIIFIAFYLKLVYIIDG